MRCLALVLLLAGCGPDHSIDFTGTYSGSLNRSGCGSGPQAFVWKVARQGDVLAFDFCGAVADYSGNHGTFRKTTCQPSPGQTTPDVLAGGQFDLNGFSLVVNASFDLGKPADCRLDVAGTLMRN